MYTLKAYRYDGSSSARNSAELVFSPSGIQVRTAEGFRHYNYADVTLQPALAGLPRQLRFADGSQCDLDDQPNLDAALSQLPGQGAHRFIHTLENNLVWIGAALLLTVVMLYGIIQYGVPVMAREVAYRMPLDIENEMGDQALAFFDQVMTTSELDKTRQQQLRQAFQSLADDASVPVRDILFRKGNEVGPNAFALPSGVIVFTDEIVALSQDDRELLAVFAHELGHVKHRHTLQHVLQNSVTGLLIVLLTGDVSTASSLAAALPSILLQSKYSRQLEAEADDFAVALLRLQDVSPGYLGDILQRMEEQMGQGDMPSFLSSHPATDERVKNINGQRHD